MYYQLSVVLGILVALSEEAIYDQRQTGETNFRLSVKDVFIAYTDGELPSDYDYSYDYSDLTVKPETMFSSSSTSTTTTAKPVTDSEVIDNNQQTESDEKNTTLSGDKKNETEKLQPEEMQIPVIVVHDRLNDKNLAKDDKNVEKVNNKRYVSSSAIRRKNNGGEMDIEVGEQPSKNCSPGFFLDSYNRCKKIRRYGLLQRNRTKLPFGLKFPQLLNPSASATTET